MQPLSCESDGKLLFERCSLELLHQMEPKLWNVPTNEHVPALRSFGPYFGAPSGMLLK